MDEQESANLTGRIAAAERVSRKLSGGGTTGDEDAPTPGPRERNRELEEAELLADEARDFLDYGEDEMDEPRCTCFADNIER